MSRRVSRAVVGALVVGLLVGSCGADEPTSLIVRDAWVRPTAAGATEAAIYLRVHNGTGEVDHLIGAQTVQCMAVQVHATTIDAGGVSRMAMATPEQTAIEPGGVLRLEPAGLHLMCTGLAAPLVAGDELVLRLAFEVAGTIDVAAAVDDR